MPTCERPVCRICGNAELALILSLGAMPLANALCTLDQLDGPEPTYPLDLVLCPACSLVQITVTVPPEQLFRQYCYFSSFSETAINNARHICERLIARRQLGAQHLAVEIASNDGYLLQHYQRHGVRVLGIEPAVNVAESAIRNGIPTLCEFFCDAVAEHLVAQGQRADVLHANNVLAHVADLHGVVAGIARLLHPSGEAIIETPYLCDLIEGHEFDTIYHEHLCYYSLSALDVLFRRHHLAILDVERLPIHGGSLRLSVGHAGRTAQPSVAAMLAAEQAWGVHDIARYHAFRHDVEHLRQELCALLRAQKAAGKRIAVYGASAKGTTLLNYFHIGKETIDFVVDRSTVKQGCYTPGTHLPIYAPETLLTHMPDYVLLLTWNFADEILAQQSAYRQRGGRFIIPLPQLRVV